MVIKKSISFKFKNSIRGSVILMNVSPEIQELGLTRDRPPLASVIRHNSNTAIPNTIVQFLWVILMFWVCLDFWYHGTRGSMQVANWTEWVFCHRSLLLWITVGFQIGLLLRPEPNPTILISRTIQTSRHSINLVVTSLKLPSVLSTLIAWL